jgi:chromosome segregation ATPase
MKKVTVCEAAFGTGTIVEFEHDGAPFSVCLDELPKLLESRNDLIKDRKELRRQLTAAEVRAERAEREYEDQDWNNLKSRAVTAEAQLRRLNAELAARRADRRRAECTEKELADVRAERDEARATRDAALDRAERAEREYEDRDWNDLKCRVATAEAQHNRLNDEIGDVREELDAALRELERLRAERDGASRRVVTAETRANLAEKALLKAETHRFDDKVFDSTIGLARAYARDGNLELAVSELIAAIEVLRA